MVEEQREEEQGVGEWVNGVEGGGVLPMPTTEAAARRESSSTSNCCLPVKVTMMLVSFTIFTKLILSNMDVLTQVQHFACLGAALPARLPGIRAF